MQSAICTLFEGHYHHGLAGLTNSLHKNGFRGHIYAGYKGQLPDWAAKSVANNDLGWPDAKTLTLADGVQIHFLPVVTKTHFTNYKPDYMLQLWAGPAKDAQGLMYFDPDIVIKCKWDFYENWITHGVAVVHEITANDMPASHPIRQEWIKVIEKSGLTVTRQLTSYINAGFCGINRNCIEFLEKWSIIIKTAVRDYGFVSENFQFTNRTDPFFAGDQDAMNIAAMCCESPLSEMGPEGMDLTYGGFTMSHAIGSPKPWKKNYLQSTFKGIAPSLADKEFWANMQSPISSYSVNTIKKKRLSMSVAGLIGRFYKKS
ncbi:hypothetical protein GCM10023149_13780 [Mucilaginibacter gynuensis]|uniref:Uncharacterized protein n=1 Tax=Mucilaginibacter gynuensis TaxID=1302236 RepID=A0ABP8G3I5_9SPHI